MILTRQSEIEEVLLLLLFCGSSVVSYRLLLTGVSASGLACTWQVSPCQPNVYSYTHPRAAKNKLQ